MKEEPGSAPGTGDAPRASEAPCTSDATCTSDARWWQGAVFYQIYPRSFLDTDGDGVGDLEGIRRRLDHVVSLGVDALWISPFFRSPMKDYGYDVSDYCDVDPLFGTLADFDRLLADAHARGLKVIVDWVPNHTSDQHPWFVESRSSRTSAKRDWYVWRDPAPGGSPPNNWIGQFTRGPAWTFDAASGQYYLHCFLTEQPDLNWHSPDVVRAMHDTLRFWLDRGVDGFRMDVVHLIGKDPALPDDPEGLKGMTHVSLNRAPEAHPLLRDIRRILDGYDGDRVSVGEVFLLDTAEIAEYYGDNDELHLSFNFLPLYADFDADAWRQQVERIERELAPRGAWPTWVLSNHDQRRHRTRYGSDARARAAAFLLLGLRGTPFLYAGEELGLEDALIPEERRLDPALRDGCRAPIPWDASPAHGWKKADNWLPWPPDAARVSAASQTGDEGSMLHLYRRLLRARRASSALRVGDQTVLRFGDAIDGAVLALGRRRAADGTKRRDDAGHDTADGRSGVDAQRRDATASGADVVVLVNFSDRDVDVSLRGTILVANDAAMEGRPFDGRLRAESAVWISVDAPLP